MVYNDEFISKLESEIEKLMGESDIFCNEIKYRKLNAFVGVLNSMKNIRMSNEQIKMFNESRTFMKGIDFSKIDVNELLNKFLRK